MKKYQVVSMIWAKKKLTDQSTIHPSHPSVKTSWRERLVPRGWKSDGLSIVRARLGIATARLCTVRAKLCEVRARHMLLWISKKNFYIFLLAKLPIFSILECSKTWLLYSSKGTKINQEKYWVVFEIFLKIIFFQSHFFQKKVPKFLYWKNFRFIFLEFSKRCLHNSSKRTQSNRAKLLSSFWDILEKDVFSAIFFRKKKVAKFFY